MCEYRPPKRRRQSSAAAAVVQTCIARSPDHIDRPQPQESIFRSIGSLEALANERGRVPPLIEKFNCRAIRDMARGSASTTKLPKLNHRPPMVQSSACAITWSCMFDLPCAQRFTFRETCCTPVSPFLLHPPPPLSLPLERSQAHSITFSL